SVDGRTVGRSDRQADGVSSMRSEVLRLPHNGRAPYAVSMMPYERLTAWQSAHELALAIYRATDDFPAPERYGLTAQLRRAGFSVAANIAEGAAKRGNGEFRRFLDIAIGSLSEVSYAIVLAKDLGILDVKEAEQLEHLRSTTSKLTWGFYKVARASQRAA